MKDQESYCQGVLMDKQIPEIAISCNNGQTEIVFSCNDRKTDIMLCRNDGLTDGVSCV